MLNLKKLFHVLCYIALLGASAVETMAESYELLIKLKSPHTSNIEQISTQHTLKIDDFALLSTQFNLQELSQVFITPRENHYQTLSDKQSKKKLLRASRAPKGLKAPDLNHTYKLRFPVGTNMTKLVKKYEALSSVEYAEENVIYKTQDITPNDASYSLQWALPGLDAATAWEITTGSSEVIVAVLDTGINYLHEDLQNKIWINAREISGNGIDDDNNGVTDDIRGYDFVDITNSTNVDIEEDGVTPDNDPMDLQYHGSHVAGIIGAETNNGIGMAGIDWNCRLMAVRVGYKTISGNGSLESDDVAAGIRYATDNDADIINLSIGSGSYSQTMAEAINYAVANGVIVFAAAGNESATTISYPAALSNTIAVGSTTKNDEISSFSNTGVSINITAPGDLILSTTSINNTYLYMSGTSQATPYAAGVAALLLGQSPSLSSQQVQDIMQNTAEDLGDPGFDFTFGYGRINALAVLSALEVSASISISNDDEYTKTTMVDLSIDTNGSIAVSMNLFGDVTSTGWIPISNNYTVALTGGQGTNTISVVLINSSGFRSATVNDTITLDTVSPNFSITSPGDIDTDSPTQTIMVSANERVNNVYIYENGVLIQTNAINSTNNAEVTFYLTKTNGSKIITLRVQDEAGNYSLFSDPIEYNLEIDETDIEFRVSDVLAGPNPFDPTVELSHIGYTLSKAAIVKLYIHDISGDLVYEESEECSAGYNEITWNGDHKRGHEAKNGGYIAYLIADDGDNEIKKVIKIGLLRK